MQINWIVFVCCITKANDTQKSRSLSPIDTHSRVASAGGDKVHLNGHSATPPPAQQQAPPPPPVTQRHSVPVQVTPINITTTTNNVNTNPAVPSSYIATKTTSSVITTTTTTEHLNSIVRRTPTPTNMLYQVSEDVNANTASANNHKLRSWSGLNGNTNSANANTNGGSWLQVNGNHSPINVNGAYKSSEKSGESGNLHSQQQQQGGNSPNGGNLTNWKSTVATSAQSDKQIVIDKSSVNEIKIQPRDAYNVSLYINIDPFSF